MPIFGFFVSEGDSREPLGNLCPAESHASTGPGAPHCPPICVQEERSARGRESKGCEVCHRSQCIQRPTLHVTTAPTSGRSWDSASLTTDTTGSCGVADRRVSSGQGLPAGSQQAPFEPNSPNWEGAAQPRCPAVGSGDGQTRAVAMLTPLSSLLFSRQPASEEKMKPCRV